MPAKFQERYVRNIGTLSEEENSKLKEKSVCIVGCGGLGGYVAENLARMGVGRITLVDGGKFEPSNLNRQNFSSEINIGASKAMEVKSNLEQINSEVEISALNEMLDEDNACEIISVHDIAVDALDNEESRVILERACEVKKIPVVHGAIDAWYGQVSVVPPGSGIVSRLYENDPHLGGEDETPESNPSFTPGAIAGIQSAEAVKILVGRESTLLGRVLFVDLLHHCYDILEV